MTLTDALQKLAVFVPELKPLIPQIVAAVATAQKTKAIVQPALDRIQAGEAAFLELADEAPQLEQLMPAIMAAVQVAEQVQALAIAYGAKVEAA